MTDLPESSRRVLAVLQSSTKPLSGRRVADLASMSPTTCNAALAALAELGAVDATQQGRARMWSATNAGRDVLAEAVAREALILTALPLEYAAVRDRLGADSERRAPSGARYCEVVMRGQNIEWTVRLFETSVGSATAAAALGRAVRDFPPDLVVFSGVAGGLRPDDQNLGDVIIIERAYQGQGGKSYRDDGESRFKFRPKAALATERMIQLARSIARDPTPLRLRYAIDVGDLATTEEVVADKGGAVSQRLAEQLNNCVAVDMETHGVYEAARQLGVPVVAVRGLSDIGGKKDSENDRNWQPVAAGNAAMIALELLIRAHPGDLGSLGTGRGTPPGPDTPSRPLPPQVSAMLETLAAESPTRADAARDDLASAKATPRTLLSMLTTHPPAWLRQDRTGLAWAIVATAGDAVETRSARTAWQQAAVTAEKGGDDSAAAVFRLLAARSIVTGHGGSGDVAAGVREALSGLNLSETPALAPVMDFWRRAVGYDDVGGVDEELMPAARLALTGLDRADLLPELSLVGAGDNSVAAVHLPAWLKDRVVADILLVVCVRLLVDDDYGRARVWANQTVKLAPWSSEARLRQAQAMLGTTHDSLSMGAAASVTDELIRIESVALQIRRDRAAWGGRTDEVLALAGRVRVEMDDPHGALALLLAPPRGTATAKEAASPAVAQISTVAAVRTGDVDLAAKLANTVEPPIERHLLRAAAFSQTSNTHDWARREYRSALELAEEPRQIRRALLGLTQLRVPVTDDPVLADRIVELVQADPEGADLVRAAAALVSGDAQTCLSYARRYRSLVAVELTSDALSALGRTEEAVDVLDDYGAATGDLALRMQALQLASRARLHERAVRLADMLIRAAGDGPLRRAARQARADIAARAGDWAEVEMQMRRLIDEYSATGDAGPDDAGGRAASAYIWPAAEALYRQRKFTAALDMLRCEVTGSAVTDPQKVRLVLAVLHQLVTEHAHLIDDELIDWVLAVGSSLINHEDIGASAAALVIQLPRSLSETQVHRSRRMLEAYFDTHGNDGTIRSLDVSPAGGDPDGEPDLTPLIEELRTSLQPRTSVLTDTAQMVLAGRIPTGFLALASHRSYAEVLITRTLGVVMARPVIDSPDTVAGLDPRRLAAAEAALDAGTVVVDTSALVLADAIADRRALIAAFAKVLLARSLYDDAYQARGNLAMRTTASMGWNTAAGKPMLIQYDWQLVDRWARTATDLDDTLALLSPVDDAPPRLGERGSRTPDAADLPITSEATARRLGSALWADDVGLLRLADADNVPAFGTPELIVALRQRAVAGLPSDLELLSRLRTERVVDLPLADDWAAQARAEQWAPESYLRLAMSRPKAWGDVADGFSEYRALVRAVCECTPDPAPDALVAAVLPWAGAACTGLGARVTPAARPRVIGALIAWTALNTEPLLDVARRAPSPAADASAGSLSVPMLEALLELSLRMQAELFPAGDGVRAVVVAVADTIRHVSDGSTAAAVLARAFSGLPEPLRSSAMSALLSAPAAPFDGRPMPSTPPSGRGGSSGN